MIEPENTERFHTVDGNLFLCHEDDHYCPPVSPWPQPLVTIHSDLGPMVTIHPDGTLEYGESYTPDEAAQQFWAAMRRWAPRQFRRPSDGAWERVTALHAPVQHMGLTWCGECSVHRSTGPKAEEWVALIPHPCPTLDALSEEAGR